MKFEVVLSFDNTSGENGEYQPFRRDAVPQKIVDILNNVQVGNPESNISKSHAMLGAVGSDLFVIHCYPDGLEGYIWLNQFAAYPWEIDDELDELLREKLQIVKVEATVDMLDKI